MKILVTGGAGFIGSHTVDALIKEGHKVTIIDDLSTGLIKNVNHKATIYRENIKNASISQIFYNAAPEIVYHFSAQMNVRHSIDDPINDAEINIMGSLNVLNNCINHGVRKIIFSSTGGALYGDTQQRPTKETHIAHPISPYGIAKLTVENYLSFFKNKINYTILRYANVYGPRQNALGEAGVVSIFCNQILHNQMPKINGTGIQTRDYIYIDDVVKANILALKNNKSDVYNIGTGIETSVNDLSDLIKRNIGSEFSHGDTIEGEQMTSCLDSSKFEKEFKWKPKINLEDGVKLTIDWFKKNDNS